MASEAPIPNNQEIQTINKDTEGVKDPGEYKQVRRIQSILDAREHVKEKRREALDRELYGEIPSHLADKIVRVAVEDYIDESKDKIQEHLPNREEIDVGSYEELSKEEQAALEVWELQNLGELPLRSGESYVFDGVVSILEAPRTIQETFEVTDTHPIHGNSSETQSVEYEIPREVSMSAYRALNYFWNQLGLDIVTQDSTHETRITSDMLEDIDTWMKRRGVEYKKENDDLAMEVS